jgi:hypothetical protein
MLHHITYVTHVTVMVMLILLVWRIGFEVMGMEFIGVMPMVQGFVRCDAGSLWIVIIPKSKDHGATTHENSTTMSLYGYGLA